VYNVEKYLRRCVDSILKQDYDSFEVILVDDGSPDNSGRICDEYARNHKNISVIHKENGGLSSARKAGFLSAKGDLICFIDSDDYVAKSYLSELSKPFSDNSVDLSICSLANDKEGTITEMVLPYESDRILNNQIANEYILPVVAPLYEEGLKNIPGLVQIRMYRRELLLKSDFLSEREYYTEDILMNILYAKRIRGNIAVINRPLYYYCINPGSLTLKYRENAFEMLISRYNYYRILLADIETEKKLVSQRLDASLASSVTFCIFNFGRIRNYRIFKNNVGKVFAHPYIVDLFQRNQWPTKATWHKIIFYAHQFGLYFILYMLLKTRKVL